MLYTRNLSGCTPDFTRANSAKCVEGEFSEVELPIYGVLGSSALGLLRSSSHEKLPLVTIAAGPLLNILRYGDKIEDPLWAEKPSPLHGRPARRQPSGVVPWARLKDLTK